MKSTKRFSGNSYIDANFTWSRNLTNSSADESGYPQNIYNVNGDYGPASISRNLIFTADGLWQVPWFREQHGLAGHVLGGWELSAIYTANSGLPLTATSSTGGVSLHNSPGISAVPAPNNPNNIVNDNAGLDTFGGSGAGLRPNQINNPNNGYGERLHASKKYEQASTPWFYSAAFQATDPSSSVPGTEKRGSIIGPGFNRADIGVLRNFRIWETLTFQLRLDAFNALNHTNVQTIGTTATSTLFGEVEGYRDARVLQIGGRFDF